MKPRWMQQFYEQHGVWPIAGGSGNEGPPNNDDNDGAGDGDEGDDDEEPDRRIKALSDEAASYRVRSKEAETRAEAAEEELQAARVELAVRREAAKRVEPFADLDVVLTLVRDSIATDNEGQPVEVSAALDHLADRHPYLLAEQAPAGGGKVDPAAHVPSGTSQNKDKNKGKGGIDRKKLEAKYPSLRRGRR